MKTLSCDTDVSIEGTTYRHVEKQLGTGQEVRGGMVLDANNLPLTDGR